MGGIGRSSWLRASEHLDRMLDLPPQEREAGLAVLRAEDPEAAAIMSTMQKLGAERNVSVLPVYAVSEDAATTILDLTATLGVDYLIIGASQRTAMSKLLRGSVVTNVAQQLPESIHLIIYG